MCEIRARSFAAGALAILVAMIALAGCGPKGQSGPASPQPPAAQAPQPAPAAPPAQPPATQPAAPAEPAPSTPPASSTAPAAQPSTPASPAAPVVARADGEISGIRVELQELKRSTNTVMLRFSIINDSQKPIRWDLGNGTGPDRLSVSGVALIDAVGKKKYLTIHDSEGHCVCSRDIPYFNPTERVNLWAKFPAPPEAVQKITVEIPHFTPMDDVPISQ